MKQKLANIKETLQLIVFFLSMCFVAVIDRKQARWAVEVIVNEIAINDLNEAKDALTSQVRKV